MAAGNRLALCLLVVAVTKASDNFYEFGNISIGEEYYHTSGSIPGAWYKYDIHVPEVENKLVTGVKVVVSGPSTPRVSYNRPWVRINYHFPQITVSDYKVTVKAVPCRPCGRSLPKDVLQIGEDFDIYGEL